jgi:hypothetical protein
MLVNGMATNPQPITTMGPPPLNRFKLPQVVQAPPKRRAASSRTGKLPTRTGKLRRNVTTGVKYIFHGKQAFLLRRSINLKECRDGGYWVHSYKPLGITAHGRTKLDSLSAFAMELSSAWHWIAQEPDEALAPDALELKRKLIKSVASVRPRREVLSELDQLKCGTGWLVVGSRIRRLFSSRRCWSEQRQQRHSGYCSNVSG